MAYIPRRIYETAEIPQAIVKEKKYIKPILKKPKTKLHNKEKQSINYLLYALIIMLLFNILT